MAARRSLHRKRSPLRGPAAPAEQAPRARLSLWLCAGAIVLLGAFTYWNSLAGAFVLDDRVSIVDNPDIRRVWSLAGFHSVEGESPFLGRPLVTLSFAINYAIGGLNVGGYHVGNIAIHILCALVLFGLIRRLCRSIPFAFACASLWMLHPLNTEAVDYLTQRTESMMGLFYVLTVYASVRARAASRPAPWLVTAVVSSILGMASKQSMVTVPVAVVLVDRVFFFESLPAAFRRRWRFYTALAGSWLVAVILVLVGPRLLSIGFSSGADPWNYLLNQSLMITRYLALTVWPRGLVADYGYPRTLALMDVMPQMLFIAALLALTAVALRHRPKLGLLGAWGFLTLAVTSSVVPIATEVGAERRMYLPLAALVVLAVSLFAWLSDQVNRTRFARAPRIVAIASVSVWAAVAASFVAGTVARNREYSSALQLARTSVDRWPTAHARHVLGSELLKIGRREEAVAYLREAIRDDPRAHFTLGAVLFEDGHLGEAREQLLEFIRLEPMLLEAMHARTLIGRTLFTDGHLDAAAEQFTLARAMQPSFPDAHLGLGDVRLAQQRFADAIVEYRAYLAGDGTNDGVWVNLGTALVRTGQGEDAIRAFRRATELNPQSDLAYRNLAATLLQKGDLDEAAEHAGRAVALRPTDPISHDLLGVVLVSQRKLDDAIVQFQQSLRLDPTDADAQTHLRQALGMRNPNGRRTSPLP